MTPSSQEINALARNEAQRLLLKTPGFAQLPRGEQLTLYKNLVNANAAALSQQFAGLPGLPGGLPLPGRSSSRDPKKASDLIDDNRHANKRIDQAGELAGEFIENVDFPKFVKDLLKGVFDANLHVTLEQMKAYQELLKTATKSISAFVNAIDNTAAFGYLAENQGDDFSIDFDDEEKDANGQPAMVLTDKQGNKLDIGDNEVKAKIMDAKLAMAREQRALLRETILMGITRLVVEKGIIKASVLFDIKASEKIQRADKAALQKAKSSGTSLQAGGGLIGKIFGLPQGGHTSSERQTQISIASTKSTATTDLAAKLAGSVEIVFKSDYFKLDNFASMYSGLAEGAAAPGAAKPAGVAAPAPAAPLAPAR